MNKLNTILTTLTTGLLMFVGTQSFADSYYCPKDPTQDSSCTKTTSDNNTFYTCSTVAGLNKLSGQWNNANDGKFITLFFDNSSGNVQCSYANSNDSIISQLNAGYNPSSTQVKMEDPNGPWEGGADLDKFICADQNPQVCGIIVTAGGSVKK